MTDAGGNVTGWAYTPLPPSVALAVDPERGRVAFAQDQARPPLVTFHYGFSANVGGGEYVRLASINGKLETVVRVASTFIADDSGMRPNVIEIEFTGGPAEGTA